MLNAIIYERSSPLPSHLLPKHLACGRQKPIEYANLGREGRKRITKVYSHKDQMLLLRRPVYSRGRIRTEWESKSIRAKSISKPPHVMQDGFGDDILSFHQISNLRNKHRPADYRGPLAMPWCAENSVARYVTCSTVMRRKDERV